MYLSNVAERLLVSRFLVSLNLSLPPSLSLIPSCMRRLSWFSHKNSINTHAHFHTHKHARARSPLSFHIIFSSSLQLFTSSVLLHFSSSSLLRCFASSLLCLCLSLSVSLSLLSFHYCLHYYFPCYFPCYFRFIFAAFIHYCVLVFICCPCVCSTLVCYRTYGMHLWLRHLKVS